MRGARGGAGDGRLNDGDERARAHLAALARTPRPAGGAAEETARRYCADVLTAAGFMVREHPFEYSASVGRWGMPIAGALWLLTLAIAAIAGAAGHPAIALGALATFALALPPLMRWAIAQGVLALPTERMRSVNLVATRGDEAPRVWLVAHLDSKSQPVPMIARIAGVGGSAIVMLSAFATGIVAMTGIDVSRVWTPLAVVGAVVAVPMLASVIGTRSPGALDNASGVATVLLASTEPALDAPPLPARCGVLLTSAEELGLAGARAWVRDEWPTASQPIDRPLVLNVDSVDDVGALRLMVASPLPNALETAIGNERIRRMARPPGVLVDAIPFAQAGVAALTVTRGTLRTLARIHTPHDALTAMRGDGIAAAARLVRRLAAATNDGRHDATALGIPRA